MKHKILLVDDQEELRSLLSDTFRVRGYDVMEASDAAALKVSLTGPQPDVVLLDFKLPDADGLDLLPLIKKQWPETESIMLTGYGTVESGG
jgi:DNA-binding NtrC family response regulator